MVIHKNAQQRQIVVVFTKDIDLMREIINNYLHPLLITVSTGRNQST